jgi:hypothetical protein
MLQKVLLVSLMVCVDSAAQVTTTRCNVSELAANAKPAADLAYLSRDQATLSSACLVKAIRNVGENRYKPAIPVLTKYLDFRMPSPFAPYNPLTQPPTGGLYPAADALVKFGEAAAPVLQSAIGDKALNPVARSNAAKALWIVAKDKTQVIAFTIKAAKSSRNPQAADALKQLANRMADHCKSDEEQRCKEALNNE